MEDTIQHAKNKTKEFISSWWSTSPNGDIKPSIDLEKPDSPKPPTSPPEKSPTSQGLKFNIFQTSAPGE